MTPAAIDLATARANLRASAWRSWLMLLAGIGCTVLAVFLIDQSVAPGFLLGLATQISGVAGILGTVFGATMLWIHRRKSIALRRYSWTVWPISYIRSGRYEWVTLLGPDNEPVSTVLLSTWPHQLGRLVNHQTTQVWFAGDPLRFGVLSRPGGPDLRYAYVARHTKPPQFAFQRNDDPTHR